MIEVSANSPSSTKLASQGYRRYVAILQHSAYWFSRVVSIPITKRRVQVSAADFPEGPGRIVIAANHEGHLDPFFVIASMPPEVFRRMGMLRFFAHSFFFDVPLYRVFLLSMGCFPARLHPTLPYGLPYAIHQLEAGDTMVIFPEGHMVKGGGRPPAKAGVGVLAQEEGVRVLPVHLHYRRYARFFFTLRLAIGKPFSGVGMSSQEIMDRVYELRLP